MANVAFIFSVRDLNSTRNNNYKLFPLTIKAKAHLLNNKLKYQNFEDYFPKNLSKKINRNAGKWATYSQFPSNLSLSLHNYFAKKLFQLTAIDNIIKTEQPTEVFLGKKESSYKDIIISDFEDIRTVIKLACKKRKVNSFNLTGVNFWPLKYLVQLLMLPKVRDFKIKEKNLKSGTIIAAHNYHVVNILPLLSFLQQFQFKPLVIGRIGKGFKALESNHIEYIPFYGEISPMHLPSYLMFRLKLLWKLYKFLQSRKSFNYDGYNLWEMLKPKLISIFLSDALNLYSHKLFIKNLVRSVHPEYLIAVTNDSTNQILIQSIKNLGIPTLEIQHGITAGYDGVYLKSDKFAVWGKIPKSIYAKNGVDSGKIVITGWPGYESHLTKTYRVRKINRENLSISFLAQDPEGASLLFMNKTPEENLGIFFKAISTLSFKNKVVVRLHPRADKTVPFAVASKYGVKFRLSETESLGDLFLKTDIVVGQTTTATLDAIIMNKPVIYLPSMSWPTKFVEGSDAVYEAKDAGDIGRYVELIIDKGMSSKMVEAQKKFIADYCNFSKSSVNLISRQIEKMINAKK